MQTIYCVYSATTFSGNSVMGRVTAEVSKDIETFDDIQKLEAKLLETAQTKNPEKGYQDLFLISWKLLK